MPDHTLTRDAVLDCDDYVSRANWLIVRGRDDLIDEIADQCERPVNSAG